MKVKQKKNNALGMIVTLACANTALYGLPFMRSQFYDIMRDALHLTNTQLSTLFSIFGAVSMGSYLVGGVLADYISVKKILLIALLVSGVLHLSVIAVPSYIILCFIFGIMAVTSVLMFYPSSMKVLNSLSEEKKGSIFGNYIVVIDILGILIVGIGLLFLMMTKNNTFVFKSIVALYGVIHFIAAFFLNRLFNEQEYCDRARRIKLSEISGIIKNKATWGVVVIFFCNYLMIGALTYVIPFLSQMYHMDETSTLIISIVRVNILAIFAAYFGGKIVDKTGSAICVSKVTFIISSLFAILIIGSFHINVPLWIIIFSVMIISTLVNAAKSINMITISEIQIPQTCMGTAIGIITFFGYSPDAFYFSFAGFAIDQWGKLGFEIIFLSLLVCGIIGGIACKLLERNKL
ncbi:MAG: MFS transporter [Eubacteriales bacterium]|nr:MFS transporter [Eubacteriales bacterium]